MPALISQPECALSQIRTVCNTDLMCNDPSGKQIDTKGFEYSIFQQLKTISQVKQFTTEQVKSDDGHGIDAVWYCIEGTTRRLFAHNIAQMNKSIRGWKNIPVLRL